MRLKKLLVYILLIVFVFYYAPLIQNLVMIPASQKIIEGSSLSYKFNVPVTVTVKSDKSGLVNLNNVNTPKNNYSISDTSLKFKYNELGKAILNFRLFGLIPVKSVTVDVVPETYVYLGGQSIGVKLNTDGIVVVGFSDVVEPDGTNINPGKEAGIRFGDVVTKINDHFLKNTDDLISQIVKSKGNIINVQIKRDNRIIVYKLKPVKSRDDGNYKIGLWVRDHTSGIGTLTFYDKESYTFGALGHPITDMDTGNILTIKDGEIIKSHITSIQPGKRNNPGEVKGIFIEGEDNIGKIYKNTPFGIYGKLYGVDSLSNKIIPIAYQSQIKTGPAKIVTSLDDSGPKEYDVEIIKIQKQTSPSNKSMVIKVTDPELIKKTGGIIQGMSGSPIIQDGKLVGAVTHVFVNDPTKGYGIYIEWMINQTNIKR